MFLYETLESKGFARKISDFSNTRKALEEPADRSPGKSFSRNETDKQVPKMSSTKKKTSFKKTTFTTI